MKQQDAPAIAVALAHIDAWSNHEWDRAREMLAPNVRVMTMTAQPTVTSTDHTGIDQYMEGLLNFAQAVEPGSAHIIASVGDQHNALILVAVQVDFGHGEMTLQSARLYALDESKKIKAEQIVFSVLSA
jgi:hypothetical protein